MQVFIGETNIGKRIQIIRGAFIKLQALDTKVNEMIGELVKAIDEVKKSRCLRKEINMKALRSTWHGKF